MTVPALTPEQLLEAADRVGLSLTEADVDSYLGLLAPYIAAYNVVDALPDNLPVLHTQPGLTQVNGLFRHGWLIGPALVEQALAALSEPERRAARSMARAAC